MTDISCEGDSLAYIYLASSAGVFLAGLVVILIAKILKIVCLSAVNDASQQDKTSASFLDTCNFCNRVKNRCQALVSGSTLAGRIMVSVSCIFSIGSLVLYIIDASRTHGVETCEPLSQSVEQIIDLGFNIFFLIYFVVRLLAANDILMFWLELNSFVDYCTIPPVFVGLILSRQWLEANNIYPTEANNNNSRSQGYQNRMPPIFRVHRSFTAITLVGRYRGSPAMI